MGGPLNGAGNSVTGIIVPTMIQLSSDLLSYWTSMTCLYDPMWVPENDRVTIPICMFHVTGIREVGTTQVSKKRILLYEPQSDNTVKEMADQVRPSVLRAITDNVVREPKMYTVNAILPFHPLGRYITSGMSVITDTIATFMTLLGQESLSTAIYTGLSVAMTAANQVKTATDLLSLLPSMSNVTYINKMSLDAMWERSHFLCMKMWTGYDYKFVMITNLEIEKKGVEDDVFRVTMQLQEMPVLTTAAPKNAKLGKANKLNAAKMVIATQDALSSALGVVTGVIDATGGVDVVKSRVL
jgi:hypothetical protein